jgi:hypothetical protein
MGANRFAEFGLGERVEDAFSEARSNAGHRSGYEYSGELSQKSSFIVLRRDPLPRAAAARLYEEGELDPRVRDKWGAAGAAPVASDDAYNFSERTVTVRFRDDYPRTEWGALDMEKITAEHVTLKADEVLCHVSARDVEIQTTAAIERTDGPAITRYHVVPQGSMPRRGDKGHETVALARAALDAMLARPAASHNLSDRHEVVGVTLREDGAGLVRGSRKAKKRVVEVRYTVAKLKGKAKPPVYGWLFFGYAPS